MIFRCCHACMMSHIHELPCALAQFIAILQNFDGFLQKINHIGTFCNNLKCGVLIALECTNACLKYLIINCYQMLLTGIKVKAYGVSWPCSGQSRRCRPWRSSLPQTPSPAPPCRTCMSVAGCRRKENRYMDGQGGIRTNISLYTYVK